MMKNILVLISICAFTFYSSAQNSEEVITPVQTKHYIGLHAGSTTGRGFSYRYWPSKLGFQFTGIPIFSGGGNYSVSTAFSLLYTLKDNKKVDLYGYFGNHLMFDGYETYPYDQFGNFIGTQKVNETTYNLGLGIGMKYDFFEVLDFNLQFGYGLNDITNGIYTNLATEVGIYYHL